MNENAQAAIHSYVTDMLALEHHFESALQGQITGTPDTSAFRPDIERLYEMRHAHIEALTALADRREIGGQGITGAVKKAAASVLGIGAAAVDFVRTEELPKNLRDDYAVLSLSCVGYMMLRTTALALDDAEVASLAERHYVDDAKMVMALQHIIPEAVVAFLSEDGLAPRTDVLPEIHRSVRAAWTSDGLEADPHALPPTSDITMPRPYSTQGN